MTDPVGLKGFQKVLQPEILYEVWAQPTRAIGPASESSSSQLRPTIEVIGGVNVYGSQLFPSETPGPMSKIFDALDGIAAFDFIPNYIYVDSGASSIVISGVAAVAEMQLTSQNKIDVYSIANLTVL